MIKLDVDVKGSKELMRKLKQHPELIERTAESVLKQEARALAVNYGAVTYPVGMSESGADKLADRVEGDIKRLFPTAQEAWKVFEVLKQKDARLAAAYWHAFKRGDEDAMAKILRRRGIAKGLDPAKHQAARVKGRVPTRVEPVSIAAPGRRASYVKKRQKNKGVAKGGWFVAAKSLGGRVRTGKGKQRFPKYVRVHGRRNGIGGSWFVPGRRARVRIWNSVSYIGSASNTRLIDSATERARRDFVKAMERAVHFANKRKFKSVA